VIPHGYEVINNFRPNTYLRLAVPDFLRTVAEGGDMDERYIETTDSVGKRIFGIYRADADIIHVTLAANGRHQRANIIDGVPVKTQAEIILKQLDRRRRIKPY
jgi:hypothetical protein